ncbi:MAG: hypothetical protein Q4E05_03865 [Pseudoclavibacter sp.]|nr:hypothetical protein [Pseudoclavibacter sp.]
MAQTVHDPARTGRPGGPAGPGRLLVVVYAVLALAATGRSALQLATRFEQAPLAYLLSALAAAVYIVATVALAGRGPRARAVAWAAVLFELFGVLAVGALSALEPELFPRDTVWSGFGRGYLLVPLVLPLAGIAWLESSLRGRLRDAAEAER